MRLLLGAVLLGAPVAAGAAAPSVPVRVGTVVREDLPISIGGLGTVQAWRSVTARAQVNGYLTELDFHEGQEVHRGDLLAVVDPRPYAALLAQAEAKKAGDAATLANYQVNYRRDSTLAHDQYASRQQADNDMALVRQFQANVLGDEAAVMQAKLNLAFCRITAPIDGVVGFRLIDVGNLIQNAAQTAIVTIQQVHPIAVVFTLAEQDLPRVQEARARGTLPAAAYSSDEETLLGRGTLVTPNNTIDSTTGTISLKAVFANRQDLLWPGQYVNVRLQLRVQKNAVVVPLEAVQHGPDGLYVYVVRPDHTVHNRSIEVGYQDARVAMVTAGLQGGESIVLDGQSRLQDGTRIAAEPAHA
ncbi:efflux RND transporter periplasmic adaptor subunit [Lichenicoccus sp.]|uniref:efflux RND transporter periplasmic adaptor subunit n=1 Tax=Lichenicoccus sp. TaxID=2781899 RepID=UPI003D115026